MGAAPSTHLFRLDLCTDLIQLPSFLGPLYKAVRDSGKKKKRYSTNVGITVKDQDFLGISCVTLRKSLRVSEFLRM